MDEPLALLRRAHEAAPDDSVTALRLATLHERAGEVGDAWTVLARSTARIEDRRRSDLTLALGRLAAREPRQLLAHFLELDAKAARRAFELLASTGEIPVLVAVACKRHPAHRVEALVALRTTLGRRFRDVPLPHDLLARRRSLGWRRPPGPSTYELWLIKKAREGRVMALAPWLQELSAWDAFEAVCGRVLPVDVDALARFHARGTAHAW